MTTTPTSTKRNTKAYKEVMAKKQALVSEYMNRVIEAVPPGNVKAKEELEALTSMLLLYVKKHNVIASKDHSTDSCIADPRYTRQVTRQVYNMCLTTHSDNLLKKGKKENFAILNDLFEIEQALTNLVNVGHYFSHKTEHSSLHTHEGGHTTRSLTFSMISVADNMQ